MSTPEIFSVLESEGACDGFLWPYEGGRLPGFTWRDGETASKYETCKGTLFMRAGKFRSYGFENDADFAREAKRGRLSARTVAGIITLGGLRSTPPADRFVYLMPPESAAKLSFPVSGPDEEAQIIDILSRRFPGSKVFSGSGFLGGVHFPTKSFFSSLHKAWQGPFRYDILFLGVVAAAVVGFTAYGVFRREGFLYSGILAAVFVLMVNRFCNRALSVGKEPDGGEKRAPDNGSVS